MLKPLILSLAVMALSGCSNGEHLAACKGPVFQLNPGHWQASAADLAKPQVARSE